MRELRNRPIAVKRGSTRACKRKEKADLQRPNNVSRTDDRGPASSRATEIRPSSARGHPGGPSGAPHTRIAPPQSFAKKSRSHACVSDFLKKARPIPRSGGVYSCFILAFPEQQLAISARTALGRRFERRFQPSLPYRWTAFDPVGTEGPNSGQLDRRADRSTYPA